MDFVQLVNSSLTWLTLWDTSLKSMWSILIWKLCSCTKLAVKWGVWKKVFLQFVKDTLMLHRDKTFFCVQSFICPGSGFSNASDKSHQVMSGRLWVNSQTVQGSVRFSGPSCMRYCKSLKCFWHCEQEADLLKIICVRNEILSRLHFSNLISDVFSRDDFGILLAIFRTSLVEVSSSGKK